MAYNIKRLVFEKNTLRALTDMDMRDIVGGTGYCSCVDSTGQTCNSVTDCPTLNGYTCNGTNYTICGCYV